MKLELFQFQLAAASTIADRFIDYYSNPVQRGRLKNSYTVPFYQALSAITGAGKTAILAQSVSEIAQMLPVKPVILWLSKGKVVVQQSYSNLADGGKYNHLLPDTNVQLLSEYNPQEVADSDAALLYFATVGTFNQRDREKSNLKIFAADTDTIEATRWEALKERKTASGLRRPLLVVYDESQNLSDQQTMLLLEQDPDLFLLASATLRFPGEFNSAVIEPLRHDGEYPDEDLITRVPTSEVQSAGLIKGIISLDGLKTPMEETVTALLADMVEAEEAAKNENLKFLPKAIYVCNTNIVSSDSMATDNPARPFREREAPPILIWRYLTEQCGIPPNEIAVYADLRTHKDFPLPGDFTLFNGGDKDYESFVGSDYRHIIFNKTLQEGWDDPTVYFAYVDKSMDSPIQISQVVGRVLRQPGACHYQSDNLNTAHFYVRVDRNETFASVIEDVRKDLGSDNDRIRIVATKPGKNRPNTLPPKQTKSVPKVAIDNRAAISPVQSNIDQILDYSQDEINTQGKGQRRTLEHVVGKRKVEDTDWVDFQQSNLVSARWVFRREVSRRYKPALTVIDTEDRKFDAKVGVGSNAYLNLVASARRTVDSYLKHAIIKQQGPNPYTLREALVRTDDMTAFKNALHDGYDDLNSLELRFATAVDETGLVWARNPSQTGYRIPLVSTGPTNWFFPDFLIWNQNVIFCVDTKNMALIDGDARRKLLTIAPNRRSKTQIEVIFITEGTWKDDLTLETKDGFSTWSLGSGQKLFTTPFNSLEDLVKIFLQPDN